MDPFLKITTKKQLFFLSFSKHHLTKQYRVKENTKNKEYVHLYFLKS